jgi:hypothetical protein
MAKFAHQDVLRGGPAAIQANANQVRLLSAYTLGDSFATVNANTLATASMAPGDFTFSTVGNNERLTAATKSGNATASAGGSPDLHVAYVNSAASKVLWVTDETSNQPITSGNPVSFPEAVYNSNQPT